MSARVVVPALLATTVAGAAAVTVFLLRRRNDNSKKLTLTVRGLLELEKACADADTRETVAGVELAGIALYGGVPPAVLSLRSLVRLDLGTTGIAQLPAGISNLTNLQVLLAPRNKLASLPDELAALAGSLVQLDVGSNALQEVPDSLCSLTRLRTLNLMGNQLAALPERFGELRSLRLLGLKSNKLTHLPASISQLTDLVELFITDNRLTDLPPGMSSCTSLVKLQASFNAFTTLPACLLHLPRLELLRVAVCAIKTLPPQLLQDAAALPRLAWFSVAGNPVCPDPPAPAPGLPVVCRDELELGQKLGDGASGDVYRAVWRGQLVAVKFFRADVSPDGRTEDEVALAISLQHPHLTQVLARVEQPHGLVLRLESGSPLALKPTSQHLLRCKWGDDVRFPPRRALGLAAAVADALRYCHAAGICHGDVYAHNVLMDENGTVTLCDFGASFSYDRGEQPFWEAMEVRAYGLMLKDVAERAAAPAPASAAGAGAEAAPAAAASGSSNSKQSGGDATKSEAGVVASLRALAERCAERPPARRPLFEAVCAELRQLQAGLP
ncbi:hypothetical protein HYH02_008726 [Chlamydomonas schloesseri]|uniref:Protein kinase domain-containing protein n=1 Tax=Chlamydomonas schloesseri TaxID=2026947 RepID=A0A835WDB1_9CHLO|nr:hypothetical protein HYH02_008726 [Chlamydomonas schloesseri]|eukprot:KAG2445258.1 hypothetical protein HYH02_008726 [Chlamydomonas schloesseri]